MKIIQEHLIEDSHKGMDKSEYRRLAGRTYEEFKKDIKKGHIIEREIIDRYALYLESINGEKPEVIDNGVDNTGEFLDIKEVNHDADFVVNGKKLEVKFIKDDLDVFRLKLNLLKGYLKQGADVLIVLGWETDNQQFTIFNQDDLKHIITFGKKFVSGDWEGKPTVQIYKSSYQWKELPKIEK